MKASWRLLAARLRAVLHLDDPPARIALALAVGVFISCSPFWGLQTILSIVVASIFRLNRAATITGTWINLPWFAPFVYGAALKIGGLLGPDPAGMRDAWVTFLVEQPGRMSWGDAVALFRELSFSLLIGTTVVGAAAGLATYVVAFSVISARRARRPDASASRPRRAA
ncbi:MAG: hypothetical protein AUH81_08470 [Candidatus Rokubacteria bacterium 13_1_40CM_4_69_5]|nr:MAG: hypothetical protein AUH81_08470 [Candidatus Rokubacteria bacterium 13_1_40CM_4_69_5]